MPTTLVMPQLAAFGVSVAFSLLAWGLVVRLYAWPHLRSMPPLRAVRTLLMLNAFRFLGLSFIIPGIVSPEIPLAFAIPAAYGDFLAAALALLAMWALPSRTGLVLAWAFNVWGSADLLAGFYDAARYGLHPGQLGATYFIITFYVPLLLIAHGVMFALLVRSSANAKLAPNSRLTTQ